jgi:hypothetical protein
MSLPLKIDENLKTLNALWIGTHSLRNGSNRCFVTKLRENKKQYYEVMKLDNKTPLTNYRIKSRQYVKWKQCWFIGVNSDGHAKTSMEPIDL